MQFVTLNSFSLWYLELPEVGQTSVSCALRKLKEPAETSAAAPSYRR
jgi:hypothetical protein